MSQDGLQIVDAIMYLTAFSALEPKIAKYLCEQGRLFREKGFTTFDEFLRTDDGRKWLSEKKGSEWLASDVGIAWLSSADGRKWVTEEDTGYAWLRKDHKYGCDILKHSSDFEWFVTSKNGLKFCNDNVIVDYLCYDSYCNGTACEDRMCNACKLINHYLTREDFLSSPAGIFYGATVLAAPIDDISVLNNLFFAHEARYHNVASEFFDRNIRDWIRTDIGKQWLYSANSLAILKVSNWGSKFLDSQCKKTYDENNEFAQSECFKQLIEYVCCTRSYGDNPLYWLKNTPLISGYVAAHPMPPQPSYY